LAVVGFDSPRRHFKQAKLRQKQHGALEDVVEKGDTKAKKGEKKEKITRVKTLTGGRQGSP
jgi:hypothetical protein